MIPLSKRWFQKLRPDIEKTKIILKSRGMSQKDSGMLKMSASIFKLKQEFSTPWKFIKASLFLRLDLPSNNPSLERNFQKTLFKVEEIENASFVF